MKTTITLGYRYFFAELSGQEVETLSKIMEKMVRYEDRYVSNVGTVNVRAENDMELRINVVPNFKMVEQNGYDALKVEAEAAKESNA